MYRALLIDSDATHAQRLATRLETRKLKVEILSRPQEAVARLNRRDVPCELVIINTSDPSQPWIRTLGKLQVASRQSGSWPRPLFLCFSGRKREPQFELAIERMGARYVSGR